MKGGPCQRGPARCSEERRNLGVALVAFACYDGLHYVNGESVDIDIKL